MLPGSTVIGVAVRSRVHLLRHEHILPDILLLLAVLALVCESYLLHDLAVTR